MRPNRAWFSAAQMGLFHPRSTTPRWTDLPLEARRQVLALLVSLLRRSGQGQLVDHRGGEAADE